MKKIILTIVLTLGALQASSTVHYDINETEGQISKPNYPKNTRSPISKPNHPKDTKSPISKPNHPTTDIY